MTLFNKLKIRNVFQVGMDYLVSAWMIAQVASLVSVSIKAPDWMMQALLLLLGLGFIVALVIAWAYKHTPEGLKKDYGNIMRLARSYLPRNDEVLLGEKSCY